MSASPLRLEGVTYAYDQVQVLAELNLTVHEGEFLVVVGPSGCGKTTLLNLLSGHDHPKAGNVHRSGSLRMIHQRDGLFPWLTVRENIALGLRFLRETAERERILDSWLSLIRLEGFEEHYPHQLSGGMRQRVELARALAGESDVLLMDEPFSALDYQTRLRMRHELVRMLEIHPRTVVLVTHDIEEAVQLADRILVLSERPARIRSEYALSLPRPRDLTHPTVVSATQRILVDLGLDGVRV